MKRPVARALLLVLAYSPFAAAQEAPAEPSPAPQTPPADPPAAPPEAPSTPAEAPAPPTEPAPPPKAPPATAPTSAPRAEATPPPSSAAPAAAASPATKEPPNPDAEKKDDQNGLLGPVRIGPLVGVGLPGLLAFGGMLKLTRYFAAGVDVGIIPNLAFKFYGDASVAYQGYDLYGHIHPFGNSFYIGAAIGYAHMTATYEETEKIPPEYAALFPELGSSITYTSEATMRTLVLSPSLGFFQIFKSGFCFGVGAGLQIPVAPSEIAYNSRTDPDLPEQVKDQLLSSTDQVVKDTLESVGQSLIPRFEIRMGWML